MMYVAAEDGESTPPPTFYDRSVATRHRILELLVAE